MRWGNDQTKHLFLFREFQKCSKFAHESPCSQISVTDSFSLLKKRQGHREPKLTWLKTRKQTSPSGKCRGTVCATPVEGQRVLGRLPEGDTR